MVGHGVLDFSCMMNKKLDAVCDGKEKSTKVWNRQQSAQSEQACASGRKMAPALKVLGLRIYNAVPGPGCLPLGLPEHEWRCDWQDAKSCQLYLLHKSFCYWGSGVLCCFQGSLLGSCLEQRIGQETRWRGFTFIKNNKSKKKSILWEVKEYALQSKCRPSK